MDFRLATPEDTKWVEDLWAYCFESKEDPFFQYYFSQCYDPSRTMVGLEQGQLLSTVHLRPYTLNVRGALLPVSYMVGVATHPAARRGGVGKELLLSSLAQLKDWHEAITILMPSKAAFYQQYGWGLYAHQWVQTMSLDDLRPLTDKTLHFGLLNDPAQWTLLAPVYEQYTKHLSGYAVRCEADWLRLIKSWFAENVYVAVARNDAGVIEAYGVYRLGSSEIPVTELVYTTRCGQKAILNYLYNHRSQGTSIRWNEGLHDTGYRFHPDGKTGHSTMPFMMSRIVDVVNALGTIPANPAVNRTGRLAVRDALCAWNHGTYDITFEHGVVRATKISDAIDRANVIIDADALAMILMGTITGTDAVFEGKMDASVDWIITVDDAYPKQMTYINEWW